MLLTIHHNGFHGWHTARCIVDEWDAKHGGYFVSERVAKRLNHVVCGGGDCKCGEYIALCHDYNNYCWFIECPQRVGDRQYHNGPSERIARDVIVITGNYPQSS